MAQTSNKYTWCAASVLISTNCSDYTDISGWANSVTWDGFDRMTGEAYTFDGDEPLVGFGPRTPGTVTVRIIFDDTTATTPLDDIIDSYEIECGGDFCVRWKVHDGGDTYTTDTGAIVTPPYPQGEKADADPTTVEFSVFTSGITTA